MSLQGADAETVRAAIESGDPLPGTVGFAGAVDGRFVRDVLGRYPLFTDADRPGRWSHEPHDLAKPTSFPAGSVRTESGTVRRWSLPDGDPDLSDSAAISTVGDAIEETLAETDGRNLAVGFSGGVDSALLAAALDAPLYSVGFPESHDLAAARAAADELDRDLRVVELDHGTLEAAIPEVSAAIDRVNAMDVQIALGFSILGKRVASDGFDRLALGQGADELFGGYAKVAKAPDDHRVAAGTVRGARREVMESLPDQLERDTLALRDRGVEPVTPFLHDRVVRAALRLSGEQLVAADGTRKWALREAARDWLPESLVGTDKKAMQYGTLVAREVDRLARQAGYKRRIDDHVTKYVESRR